MILNSHFLLDPGSPFKPQYSHTNSPNWSPYISLKNELREFDKGSRHFYLGDNFINSHNLSVDNVWILLGENNWSWSLWDFKGWQINFNLESKVICNVLTTALCMQFFNNAFRLINITFLNELKSFVDCY